MVARIFKGRVTGDLASTIRGFSKKISDINQRYATPKIRMSRWVKFSLLVLRIYLVFLVILLGYKFWTMLP